MSFFDNLKKKFGNKDGRERTMTLEIAIPDIMGIEDLNGRLIRYICCNNIYKVSTHYGMDLWAGFIAFKDTPQVHLTKSDWIPVCFELQHPNKKLTTYAKKFFLQNEMFNMLKKIGMELNLNKVSREHYNFLGRVFVTDDRLIVAMNEPPKPNIYSDLDKLDNQLTSKGVPEPKLNNSVTQEEIDAVLGKSEDMAEIARGENGDVAIGNEKDPFGRPKAMEGVTRASYVEDEPGEIVNPTANTMEPYFKPGVEGQVKNQQPVVETKSLEEEFTVEEMPDAFSSFNNINNQEKKG